MTLKSLMNIFLFSILLKAGTIGVNAQAPPTDTVKAFYKWYVHALNTNVAEPLKDKANARKYVTARLLGRIEKQMNSPEGIDADYFLSAQDFDPKWESNIVIGKVSTTASSSTVNAVLPSKLMGNSKLKILLKKEAGVWKIDRVNDYNI